MAKLEITCFKSEKFVETYNYLCCKHMLLAEDIVIADKLMTVNELLMKTNGRVNPSSAFAFVTSDGQVMLCYQHIYEWLNSNGLMYC